jgi:phage terminase large subunit-like protein
MESYVARANAYALAVVAGNIPNCRWVIRACKRHLKDLERSRDEGYPFRLDEQKATKVCAFGEELAHVKGRWAKRGENIRLEDWQCFVLVLIFGWVWKTTGLRRFRKVYLKIPRKNGKSILAAIIGLYMWCGDGEFGAEVYSGATTEKQAWEVFRPAKQMLQRAEELRDFAGVSDGDGIYAKSLVVLSDESRFEPIIGQPGDGASAHCSIHDEYHEHDSPDQIDAMETGMGSREQPILLIITTAGYNIAGPCYELEVECRKVLLEAFEEDTLFCLMYGIDESEGDEPGDDWADPLVLRKANPNYDVSVSGEFLQQQQRQAVLNVAHQNRFKTKHLNVWCGAKHAWMPLAAWDACADKGLTEDEFKGEPCLVIVDLASKDDIAVVMKLFHRDLPEPDGRRHYYVFANFYLPESAIDEDDPSPNLVAYKKWVRQELLTLAGEHEIDFDVIEEDAKAAASKFQVEEFLYDPWRATQLAQHITKDGGTAVEVRQTVQNLSLPMKEVLSAVKAGRIHHDGNPVLRWMVSNVVAKEDAKENIYPRKEKEKSPMKIDGAVTLIMGMSRAMRDPESGLDDWLKSIGPRAVGARP